MDCQFVSHNLYSIMQFIWMRFDLSILFWRNSWKIIAFGINIYHTNLCSNNPCIPIRLLHDMSYHFWSVANQLHAHTFLFYTLKWFVPHIELISLLCGYHCYRWVTHMCKQTSCSILSQLQKNKRNGSIHPHAHGFQSCIINNITFQQDENSRWLITD